MAGIFSREEVISLLLHCSTNSKIYESVFCALKFAELYEYDELVCMGWGWGDGGDVAMFSRWV